MIHFLNMRCAGGRERIEPIHSSIISLCVSVSAAGSYSLSAVPLHSINHQCRLGCWSRTVKRVWCYGYKYILWEFNEFVLKEAL